VVHVALIDGGSHCISCLCYSQIDSVLAPFEHQLSIETLLAAFWVRVTSAPDVVLFTGHEVAILTNMDPRLYCNRRKSGRSLKVHDSSLRFIVFLRQPDFSMDLISLSDSFCFLVCFF
jgi:hypothetical protein